MIRKILTSIVAVTMLCGTANAGLIEVWDGATTNLAGAMAIIAGGGADASDNFGVVDFDDGGDGNSQGSFGVNNPFPGGFFDFFVARVTGTVMGSDIPFGDFRIEHDDGFAFYVNGVLEAVFDGLTDNIWTFATVALNPGLNTIEIIFWEYGGGATLELVSRVPGTENGAHLTEVGKPVPEPGTLALLGIGLAGMGMARRRKNV